MGLTDNEKRGEVIPGAVTDPDGRHIVTGPDAGTTTNPVRVANADGSAISGGSLSLVSESTPGAAVPAKALSVAGSDGTNLRRFAVDASGVQQVDVLAAPLPTAASKGYQQVTGTGLATLVIPAGATKALLQPAGSIRFRDDATPPSSSVGYPVGTEGFDYDADRLVNLAVYVVAGNLDIFYYA